MCHSGQNRQEELEQISRFILEADKLKQIKRQTLVSDGSRQETSAEHSWHLALMCLVLAEYAAERLDVCRVLAMLVVHDLVEIYTGDVLVYNTSQRQEQKAEEQRAAERLFGMLPQSLGQRLLKLWQEFENRNSAEARFAAALDRLQPLLLNLATQGRTWQKHGVQFEQVVEINRSIADGSPPLWEFILPKLEQAAQQGILPHKKQADAENA